MTNPRATNPDVFFETVEAHQLHVCADLYDPSRQFGEDHLRNWFRVHVAYLDALRSGEYIDAFRDADWALLYPTVPGRTMMRFPHELMLRFDDYRARWEIIDKLRQRLRWLWILYEGLAKDPVLIPSGEQQPRMRTRHIVHPAQPQQDALNEFAGQLVNPPEQYIAHVRMPRSYHRVKLAAPLRSIAPGHQVEEVRRRSQEEYHAPARWDEPESPSMLPRPPGRIGRRPRPQRLDPAQEVLPEPPDEDLNAADTRPDDQNGGSETVESEDDDYNQYMAAWNAIVEGRRRDAELKGDRFTVVSDREIMVEEIPKPGDLIISRRIWTYHNETLSWAFFSGFIDEDTGEITWLPRTKTR
jgi:hypothetical protein